MRSFTVAVFATGKDLSSFAGTKLSVAKGLLLAPARAPNDRIYIDTYRLADR